MIRYNHSLTPQQNRIEVIIENKQYTDKDVPNLLRALNDLKEHVLAIQHLAGTAYSLHIAERATELIETIEKRGQ